MLNVCDILDRINALRNGRNRGVCQPRMDHHVASFLLFVQCVERIKCRNKSVKEPILILGDHSSFHLFCPYTIIWSSELEGDHDGWRELIWVQVVRILMGIAGARDSPSYYVAGRGLVGWCVAIFGYGLQRKLKGVCSYYYKRNWKIKKLGLYVLYKTITYIIMISLGYLYEQKVSKGV